MGYLLSPDYYPASITYFYRLLYTITISISLSTVYRPRLPSTIYIFRLHLPPTFSCLIRFVFCNSAMKVSRDCKRDNGPIHYAKWVPENSCVSCGIHVLNIYLTSISYFFFIFTSSSARLIPFLAQIINERNGSELDYGCFCSHSLSQPSSSWLYRQFLSRILTLTRFISMIEFVILSRSGIVGR